MVQSDSDQMNGIHEKAELILQVRNCVVIVDDVELFERSTDVHYCRLNKACFLLPSLNTN